MSIRTIVTTFAAVLLFAGGGAIYAAEEGNGYSRQKVVYHINDLESASAALGNVRNHLNAVGDDRAEIVVVTHSDGAYLLVEGSQDAKGRMFDASIQQLADRGVKFQICNNTIVGKKIDTSKLNMNAEIVPSGVAQVAHLQQQGFVYVKP